MKKIFLLLVVTCAIGLTSCSNDDNANSNANTIVGVWGYDTVLAVSDDIGLGEGNSTEPYRQEWDFKSDNTGQYESTRNGVSEGVIAFTWSKSGSTYTAVSASDTETYTIGDHQGTDALMDDEGEIAALRE